METLANVSQVESKYVLIAARQFAEFAPCAHVGHVEQHVAENAGNDGSLTNHSRLQTACS